MSVSKFFKAYDLRGTTPELTREVYFWSGFALISEILTPQNLPLKVVVMRDCRLSSPQFYEAFIAGIKSAGGQTVNLGIGTTDTLYAASIYLDLPGAIITASHNPKDDNGLKIVKEIPQMLGLSTGLDKIRDFVAFKMENEKTQIDWQEIDTTENQKIKNEVMDFFVTKIKQIGQTEKTLKNLNRLKNEKEFGKLKIVVDTANGMGGFILPYLQEIYGESVEFVPLFWELDGSFPNHPADPMSESNLQTLKETVLATKADFGIAMDGDADRAFFVDEMGNLVNGGYIVPLFAENLLQEYFQKTNQNEQNSKEQNSNNSNSISNESKLEPAVVYPISYSRNTGETVLENGGVPIISLQGHTFIKQKMEKFRAIYGGEASGHHYFGEFGFMDSGAITIALFIKIWTEKNIEKPTPASQICQFWSQKYFVSGEHNFLLQEGLTMPKIKEIIHQNFPKTDFRISELDGVTVYNLNYKFTIRGSNTEPLLRINVESKNEDKAMKILEEIKTLLGIK